MIKQQKYLFFRFILNIQIYLILISAFINIVVTLFLMYLDHKLIITGLVDNLQDIPKYLNSHNVLSYLNMLELIIVIVFSLLWIYLVVLAYKKALTKMVFKKYKRIIITTKLKRISYLKSSIYCLCDGIISAIVLQITLVIYGQPQTFDTKMIIILVNCFLLWNFTEYLLLNWFCSKYLKVSFK